MSGRVGLATLLAAVLRGLRARASLTAGCLLLAAVAIASAVLGPAYQSSASQSFLVARLTEASPVSTGVSVAYAPDSDLADDPAAALDRAATVGAAQLGDRFGPATTTLDSSSVSVRTVFGLPWAGTAEIRAKQGGCEHLTLAAGVCPTQPGQVMMLAADAASSHVKVGDTIRFPAYDGGKLTLVGLYNVPDDVADFWFDESRFFTGPPSVDASGGVTFNPAPLVADPSTFDGLAPASWTVDIDRFLSVSTSVTPEQVRQARQEVVDLPRNLKSEDGGTFRATKDNGLQFVIAEIDQNRATASKTVTPAVVSLVLVALALLVRLLGAAADQRRSELALASLRGMSSRQMWVFGLAEPCTLLLLAAPLGVLLGYGMTVWLAGIWLIDGIAVTIGPASILAAALVWLAAIGASVFTVRGALSEPLSSQLAGVRRPTRSGRWALIAKMVLVIAAVAVVAASLTASGRSDPKASDLVLPLLLAGAAGLLITAATVWAAGRLGRRTSRRRGITTFVATRAVSRRREGSLVILPLTAALAISVFAAGVFTAAATWRASTAATRVGADASYRSDSTLAQTVALTHRLDPDGKWLMAVGAVNQGDYGEKLVIDAPRLARVGVWPGTWTPGLDAGQVADLLGPRGPGLVLKGSAFSMTLDNQVTSSADGLGVSVEVESADGESRTMFFGPFKPGQTTTSTKVDFCRDSCQVLNLLVGGPATSPAALRGTASVSAFTADGRPDDAFVSSASWRPVVSPLGLTPDATTIDDGGTGLTMRLDSGGESALGGVSPSDVPAYRPVLLGRAQDTTIERQQGDRLVVKTDALEGLPVRPVAQTESMPFFGPRGMVIDVTMMTRDQDIPKDATDVYVLARGDTPQALLASLNSAGVTGRTELSQVRRLLDQDAYALSLNLYLVAALAAVALALAGLAVNLAVQMPDRRRDAASLRVVGVRRRQIMRAVFVEICAVLGAAGLAGILAGSMSQYIVVRTVTLGFVGDIRTPRVVPTIDVPVLSLLVGVVVVVLVTVATVVATLAVRRARASTLRESVR
jgi:hypothetical protein